MGLETTWPSVGCCRVRPISTQGHKKFSQTTEKNMVPAAALPPKASIFSQKHQSLQLAIYNSPNVQNPTTRSRANALPLGITTALPPGPALQRKDVAGREGGGAQPWPCPGNVPCSPPTAGEEELQEGKGTCLRPYSTAVAEQGPGSTLLGRCCHHDTNPSCL